MHARRFVGQIKSNQINFIGIKSKQEQDSHQ